LQPMRAPAALALMGCAPMLRRSIRYVLLAVYVALGSLPPGSIPSHLLIQQALGAILFASYVPQLLSVFEKLF
jgi:hypothetical protein